MKLRDHPIMKRKNGFQTWPPLWTTTHHDKDDKPIGEVGILEDVIMSTWINEKGFSVHEASRLTIHGFHGL